MRVPQLAPRQLNKSRVATKRCLFRIEDLMRIHVGCELSFEFPQTTPMIVMLNVHFSRVSGLEHPDYLITNPSVPIEGYRVKLVQSPRCARRAFQPRHGRHCS